MISPRAPGVAPRSTTSPRAPAIRSTKKAPESLAASRARSGVNNVTATILRFRPRQTSNRPWFGFFGSFNREKQLARIRELRQSQRFSDAELRALVREAVTP